MLRTAHILFLAAAAAAAGVAVPAFAWDGQDRAQASPARTQAVSQAASQAASDDGFLYFRDEDAPAQTMVVISATAPTLFTPRPIIDLDQARAPKAGFVGLFTPRRLNAQIGLLFGRNADTEDKSSIGLSLTSHISQQDQGQFFAPTNPDASVAGGAFEGRRYNFGLAVDYWGFSLGAGLIREETALDDVHTGVDLGLSYRARSWRTSLQVMGLQTARASRYIDLATPYDRMFAVELGAAYALTPGWSLTGGLRYSGFRDRFDFGLKDDGSDSRVFMGTAITF
ncbi:MAG: hypothetical protein ACOY99_12655 [Pseudomonadota bacterium]|jgi:opacity protein-like surface antigen